MSGHFVSGHIDCVGRIRGIKKSEDAVCIEVAFPEKYNALTVEKGSIALDGISLTIGKIGKSVIAVYIIPHTLKMTTLSSKRAGDEVNVEFDLIGKYAANLHNKFEKASFS